MTLQACMGGMCTRRAGCPHYNAADRSDPAERLCVPGVDGTLRDEPRARLQSLRELIQAATV